MINSDNLKIGFIVGIIDAYGCVHSKFDMKCNMHGDLFPMQTHKRWRWCLSSCFDTSIDQKDFTEEDWDKIQRHITRKYGIHFYENGYTDLEHFYKKFE